jgi:hypothetical protein
MFKEKSKQIEFLGNIDPISELPLSPIEYNYKTNTLTCIVFLPGFQKGRDIKAS